jgi:DNA primase
VEIFEWCDANLENVVKSAGYEISARCVVCGKVGGFYVNCDPDKSGPWVCFKCGARGHSFGSLVAKVEGISIHEANSLIFRYFLNLRRKTTPEKLLEKISHVEKKDELKKVEVPIPEEFIPVFDGKIWRVPQYLTDRGFAREVLNKFNIGFCEYGKFRYRVIIPIECENGYSFTARDLTGKQNPKYLNPKGANHKRLVFGWGHVNEDSDFCIVEGPLDSIKLYQYGIPSIALLGKTIHKEQLNLLFKRPKQVKVTVMLDNDAQIESYNVAMKLIAHFENVYIAKLTDGVDPGSSTKAQVHEALSKSVRFSGDRTSRISEIIKNSSEKLHKKFSI